MGKSKPQSKTKMLNISNHQKLSHEERVCGELCTLVQTKCLVVNQEPTLISKVETEAGHEMRKRGQAEPYWALLALSPTPPYIFF